MFLYTLKPGAVKRLNSLLKNPLSFDSIEFIESNKEQIAKLPSDINDIYQMCNAFELGKQNLYPLMNNVIYQLQRNVGLVGLNGVIPCDLPIEACLDGASAEDRSALDVNRVDIINQQIERLHELFSITDKFESKQYLTCEVSRVIEVFLLSEHMYLVLYGLAKVKHQDSALNFSVNDEIHNTFFKPKWFANFWETTSSITNFASFNLMPDGVSVSDARLFIKSMSDIFLDKVFSINSNYITRKLSNTDGFKSMGLICDIIALLFYSQFKLNKNHVHLSDLNAFGLAIDDIEKVKLVNNELDHMDRLFNFRPSSIELVNPCVSIRSRRLIESLIKVSSGNKFDDVIGHHFEKQYIPDYILNNLNDRGDRFRLHGELLSEQAIPGEKDGDVDLIVEDTCSNKFYFMQIKYLRNAGKPFIRGDVEYLTNKNVHKGVFQLAKMKEYHAKGMLNQILESKNIATCIPENTTYMLVTNVTNLDFQKDERSGVVCYEWNSLRNLLLNGRCWYGNSNDMHSQKEWRYHSPLPLEEPSMVIDILLTHSPALKAIDAEHIFRSKYLATKFSVGDVQCNSIGLGM
ncbi:hypothetical protein KW447_21740 [Vibrio fluvialis]|nr:hypothetical protein [Vibrio fluvialis]